MTSNWHRRFWRIFYLPFPWSRSTLGISLYEAEHFDLCGTALGIWQLVFFSLSCLFVIDTTVLSPLLPPALHFAAGQTVVGFVGLNAWSAHSNFLWSVEFRLTKNSWNQRKQVPHVDTYWSDLLLNCVPVMTRFA